MSTKSDEAETMIADFNAAFTAANKRPPPTVTYKRGWVLIDYGSHRPIQRFRLSYLKGAIRTIRARVTP